MGISIFDLFSIGIGPSSSHTVGPMRAARQFAIDVKELHPSSLRIHLYGSLALTGKGHGTDIAILLGLEGETPEGIDPNEVPTRIEWIRNAGMLSQINVKFHETKHLIFHRDKQLPFHPNGMKFQIFNSNEKEILSKTYYSIGGGFIVDHDTIHDNTSLLDVDTKVPYPFKTGDELLNIAKKSNLRIDQVIMENEKTKRTEKEIKESVLLRWQVMQGCVKRGCSQEGTLPGGLQVQRRAPGMYQNLLHKKKENDPISAMRWVSLWALAVNEENAGGGRIVTAPTNGSAGIIPSVLHYYMKFTENPSEEGIVKFFLTSGAIGILYKIGASISGAEMGCMGEVGVACSMAAAGLTAALGGTNEQTENAAEIGMEHHLGMTCDPVKGLVQIPCIERNAMGAVKAINASLLALETKGRNRVTLDQVINTMRQTGKDMQSIYKETSLGGLAVNVPEC